MMDAPHSLTWKKGQPCADLEITKSKKRSLEKEIKKNLSRASALTWAIVSSANFMDIPLLATLKKITNRNSQWHGDDTQPPGNVGLCLAKKSTGNGSVGWWGDSIGGLSSGRRGWLVDLGWSGVGFGAADRRRSPDVASAACRSGRSLSSASTTLWRRPTQKINWLY